MTASGKWIVGIPEPQMAPFDIEQKAFPEADFRLLPDWRAATTSQRAALARRGRAARLAPDRGPAPGGDPGTLPDRGPLRGRLRPGRRPFAEGKRDTVQQQPGLRHRGGGRHGLRHDPGPPAQDRGPRPAGPRLSKQLADPCAQPPPANVQPDPGHHRRGPHRHGRLPAHEGLRLPGGGLRPVPGLGPRKGRWLRACGQPR